MSWPCHLKVLVDGTHKAWKFRKARLSDPALQHHYGQGFGLSSLGCLTWDTGMPHFLASSSWLPHWGKGWEDGNRNIHSGFPSLFVEISLPSAFRKSKETTMTMDKKRGSQQTHIKREEDLHLGGDMFLSEWEEMCSKEPDAASIS